VLVAAAVGAARSCGRRRRDPARHRRQQLVVGGDGAVRRLADERPAGLDAVQHEFAGIPQQGRVLGRPNAPVTMVEYVDLQCPGCRALETEVMPTIVPELVRTGKLKIEARPIAFIGPDSVPARYAAIAAGSQNKMFNFMQVVYANQGVENTGWLNHAFIEKAAASVPGMQVQRLLDDQKSNAVINVGKTIDGQANADNVSQTPTLFIGRTGGQMHVVSSKDTFDAMRLAAAIRRLGG
jgi:protein-disulfide isomerase